MIFKSFCFNNFNSFQESLVRVCEEGGYEWMEDPTNSLNVHYRNRICKIISQNPHIKPGIVGLVDTCGLVRDKIRDIGECKKQTLI